MKKNSAFLIINDIMEIEITVFSQNNPKISRLTWCLVRSNENYLQQIN